MFTWRMEVKDETFTSIRDHPSVGQDYITPDDGVATLDDFSVDGAGNCLEARFRASPKFVDIRARDIVSLEVSEDGGSTWTPVYRGYVVTAGNPRSQDVQEYKLNGLRQRFFEITNEMEFTNDESLTDPREAEVADQVEVVLQYIDDNNLWPAGVVQTVPTVPDFDFIAGVRYPQKESFGDTFKALSENVGRFIVPTGASYTYDGETYNEGDVVPGAKFGVDAAGNFIFKRPQETPVAASELQENVVAEYTQVTGEEIIDTVELRFASSIPQPNLGTFFYASRTGSGSVASLQVDNAALTPLSQTFTFGDTDTRRVVELPSPQSLMRQGVELFGPPIGGVTNPTGAFSGGTTTLSGGNVAYQAPSSFTSPPVGGFTDGFIMTVSVEANASSNSLNIILGGANTFSASLQLSVVDLEQEIRTYTFVSLPSATLVPDFLADPSGDTFAPIFSDLKEFVTFSGSNIELSNLEMFFLDRRSGDTPARRFASGFVRDVQQDVAEVRVVNELGAVAPRMNWTPEGEAEVTVPVERIQYTLTPNDGLITTYELGQAFDAELLSERAVLKGLAREAVNE